MQHNAYYNDSLSSDDSGKPLSTARQIALRVQHFHETYLKNQPEGAFTIGEFFCLFFKYEHNLGSMNAAFDMLEMIANVPAESIIAAFQEAADYSRPRKPIPPIAEELAQELADSRTAPRDVKALLSQLQALAVAEEKSLTSDFEAEHVINLMAEKFEIAVGGMRLLQLDGLPLYTGSFTYAFEN